MRDDNIKDQAEFTEFVIIGEQDNVGLGFQGQARC